MGESYEGPFLVSGDEPRWPEPEKGVSEAWVLRSKLIVEGQVELFGLTKQSGGNPPDWFLNHVTGKREEPVKRSHWSESGDFDLQAGDVKGVWEISRFSNLLALSLGGLCSRSRQSVNGINVWLQDWVECNPFNSGINWKCGQEVALRLVNFLFAVALGERHGAWSALEPVDRFVEEHCLRIEATMGYARAQDNNHAVSEALGLFVGGTWLADRTNYSSPSKAKAWAQAGRNELERSVSRLVMPDGSFSQNSVNYHRLLIDLVCLGEVWRRWKRCSPFSRTWQKRCRGATLWLTDFVDEKSGKTPNLGANDGAYLLSLHRLKFGDYRPSIQLASALFGDSVPLPVGAWDEPFFWFGIASPPRKPQRKTSKLFPKGGYALLVNGNAKAFFRVPHFRFRPSHADGFHVDFWWKSKGWLRDGGTFSYSCGEEWLSYFSGAEGHNLVRFDQDDQMPRISRFLFGRWLTPRNLSFDASSQEVSVGSVDYRGVLHRRSVSLLSSGLRVVDEVDGFKQSAVLQWRLAPGNWEQTNPMEIQGEGIALSLESTVPLISSEIETGWESAHYSMRTKIPVWKVAVGEPGTMVTTVFMS